MLTGLKFVAQCRRAAAVVGVAAVLGCADRSDNHASFAAGECQAASARTERPLALDAEGSIPPCELRFEPSGVVLRGDESRAIPDPGGVAVRDSKGILYTTIAFGSGVAVWSESGEYLRTIGGDGFGPGEFVSRGGSLFLYVDGKDQLYVRDNAMRVSVFSPSGRFLRLHNLGAAAPRPRSSAILKNGDFIIAAATPATQAAFARVITTSEKQVAIGGDGRAQSACSSRERTLIASDDPTFWASPCRGAGVGYLLEHWNVDGSLVDSIRRNAEWLPDGADMAPNARHAHDNQVPDRPPSVIELANVDQAGFLLTVGFVVTDRWRPVRDPLARDSVENSFVDAYMEVIDPVSQRLLATTKLPESWDTTVPLYFFHGSRLGYLQTETPNGVPELQIWQYHLSGRAGSGGR